MIHDLNLPTFEIKIFLSSVVDTTTGLPSSATDTMMFINTSTSSVCTQDDGYITTDIMLNTLNETITISRQVTTSHEYDDLNDTENNQLLSLWQILLIIATGVLFLIFSVVIIMLSLHRNDKKYSNKRLNQHLQHQTHPHVKNSNPTKQHPLSPQGFHVKHYNSPSLDDHPNDSAQLGLHYHQNFDNRDLLVSEGHQSVINIIHQHNNNDRKYAFGNMTTRYNRSYVNKRYNMMNETKLNYQI